MIPFYGHIYSAKAYVNSLVYSDLYKYYVVCD